MASIPPIAPPVEPRLLTLRAIVALSDLINSDAHPEQRAGLESCRDGLRRLALPPSKTRQGHVLFAQGDLDAPDSIKDRNGDIVLDLCRICGKAEIELDAPCTANTSDLPARDIELEPCPPAQRPFPTMASDVTGWHFGDVHVRGSVLAAAGVCTAALARYEDTPDARELDGEAF